MFTRAWVRASHHEARATISNATPMITAHLRECGALGRTLNVQEVRLAYGLSGAASQLDPSHRPSQRFSDRLLGKLHDRLRRSDQRAADAEDS